MTYIQGIKYNLSEYNCRCPVCDKQFKSDKPLANHIFNRYLKDDKEHAKIQNIENFIKIKKSLQFNIS